MCIVYYVGSIYIDSLAHISFDVILFEFLGWSLILSTCIIRLISNFCNWGMYLKFDPGSGVDCVVFEGRSSQ